MNFIKSKSVYINTDQIISVSVATVQKSDRDEREVRIVMSDGTLYVSGTDILSSLGIEEDTWVAEKNIKKAEEVEESKPTRRVRRNK